jgi:hypothetical protein
MARQPRKPNKDFKDITQAGEKAHKLVSKHRAVIEPRLEAGLIDGLRADLDGLGGQVAGTTAAQSNSQAATATQNTKLSDAHDVLSGIRHAVQKSNAKADVRRAYGLGAKLNASVVSSVQANGKVVIDRARLNPTEARGLGILDADINTLEALLLALKEADANQEKTRAAAPLTTGDRNAAGNRIIEAVRSISAKGVLEFARDPKLRAQFGALDDGPAVKKAPPTPK